jgi:large conductance mechanosensitive channel
MLANLKSFLVRDNVLALAVGIIIGGAFGKIVTTLVDKLIMPVIGIFMGGVNFKGLEFKIGNSIIGYGEVIQAIIDFVIIGIVLYFLLKAAGQKPGPPAPTPSEALLAEIRDELRKS